jgi:tetratricopeptide (TPR) repeat protein
VLRAGAWIWLVTWFPISHAVVSLERIIAADRYLLLPILGVSLALAAGLAAIPIPRARLALTAAIVVAGALRTLDAQASWASSRALWSRAVESSPADGDAWSFYAEAEADGGDPRRAMEAVETGLSYAPGNARLILRHALYLLPSDRAAGRAEMLRAAKLGEVRAMSNVALLALEDHDMPMAIEWGQRAAAARESVHAQQIWGKVALAAHRYDEALAAFTTAVQLQPDHLAHHYNRGLALLALHRAAEAIPELEAAEADPALADAARAALIEARARH